MLAGCQPDPPRRADMVATFDIEPDLHQPVREPKRLTSMTATDIRRSAMTCLSPPPYLPDGGPRCLRPDGTWIGYSGWGDVLGRYTIAGNEVRMEPPDVYRGLGGTTERVAFYRSDDGRIFLRHGDSAGSPVEVLEPYSEAEFRKAS